MIKPGNNFGLEKRLSHRSLALLILLGAALASFSGSTLSLFRSVLRDYLALDEARYGLLLSIGICSGSAGSILAGVAGRKMGAMGLFKPVFLLCGIGYAIVGFVNGFPGVLAGLFLCGFAAQALTVVAQSGLTELFPQSCRKILSFQMVFSSVWGMFYSYFAEQMLTWSVGVPSTFGLFFHGCFLFIALCMFLCVPFFPGNPRERKQTWTQATVHSLPFLPAVLTFISMTFHGLADTLLFLWMPRVLEQPGYLSYKPGYVFLAISLVYVVSRSLLAFLKENSFQRAFLCLPGICGAAVLTGGLLFGGRWTAIGYIVGSFLWSMEFPAMLALLRKQVSDRGFTSWLAGYYCFVGLFATMGSSAIGWLADKTSLSFAQMLLFPAVLFALASVLCICNIALARRRQDMPLP